MSRIRTLEFLPSIFQTPTNSQFLGATLDQLVNPPVTKTIQGYIGSKLGYGVNAENYYVTEPTKERTDYQLEPGVVFLKEKETIAKDFISYPGIINSLKLQQGITDNNNDLFSSQIYSFDPFCSYDPIINFNQYYWLPNGLPAVTVAASTVFSTNDYVVTYTPSAYNIRPIDSSVGVNNPTLTLLRGGTYNFIVDQDTQFWIQGEPGVSGYSATQTNQYVRDIYGVDNNGANSGIVTFTVPAKDAQDEYLFPGNNPVGVVSTEPFANINGKRLSEIGNIDGVTSLNGRTVMFYHTGITNEIGYVSSFYDSTNWETNDANIVSTQTITVSATDNTGNITVSDTANLNLNNSVTFTGTSVGGLLPYDATASITIPATGMTIGQQYYIQNVGTTDWISAGVNYSTQITGEINGTQLIVDTVLSGIVSMGQTVTGSGVTAGTIVTTYDPIATATNGKPTYTINNSQTVSITTLSLYDIKSGYVFTCTSVPVSGSGTVATYTPTIYYITSIDTGTNQIQVSETLDGPTFVTTADTGTMTAYINQGLYEEGYYTTVNDYFYLIEYISTDDPADPILRLTPNALIPVEEKIVPQYGTQWIGLGFVKYASTGTIELIPYISAPLDTLYYQDGTNPNCVGTIKLIESNTTNTINVELDILGKTNYTAPNGVEFTNGLKVKFDGDIIPISYLTGEYYVEGVGTTAADGGGIQLISVDSLVLTEEIEPTVQDYITIARNSINKNAWARSNRWFHNQVIQVTAEYNNNPEILNIYGTNDNKAKRPILQFYPNIKLYNSGTYGKETVDFIDFRTTDAFQYIEGQACYYPDVQTYTTYTGTINSSSTPIAASDMLENQWYEINDLGTTNSDTWQQLGATLGQDGSFEIGVEYIITDVGSGTNWTAIGCPIPAIGTKFTAISTGTGAGTGKALTVLFKAIATDGISSNTLIAGLEYEILVLGTTQWNNIAESSPPPSWGIGNPPVAGGMFIATGPGIGTGTAAQGDGTVISKSVTTIEINSSAVTGTLQIGQWINDMIIGAPSQLPEGTRILSIQQVSGVYTITVYWSTPTDIAGATLVSLAASTENNANLALFDGCRIVFADEIHSASKTKIYVANFNDTGSEPYPIITLTEASDGEIIENDQFPVSKGFNYKGTSFYYFNDEYVQAQQKLTQNQAPLFDIFDSNGISLGNPDVYNSTTFKGTKLFAYQIGTGINDAILGFPISYSSFKNVNDIRFAVSLYTDEFSYVSDGSAITANISNGYVYNYSSRIDYTRMIGWQTAIAPSQQYQVFQFNYYANEIPTVLAPEETIDFTVTCDVPQSSTETTIWPSLQVFNNNTLLTEGTEYTVTNTDSSTVITVLLTQDTDTVIEVLILSDQVSEVAYYTIPVNLANNPFNSNPEYIDLGDIRGQYQSIYINSNISGDMFDGYTNVMFGSNNYRDLGNLVPYGNRIIQNSASLVLPGAFLRNTETNLFNSLLFNSREYIKFKTVLVDCINRIANNQKYDPATLLDQAMEDITAAKNQTLPFFWSDMLPNKSAYITNVYNFANGQDTSIFPLSKVYNFSSANYDGVLVYLQRKINGVLVTKQFTKGIDYTISTDSPNLTVTTDLISGDRIIVKEYNATYGSYVPNTPTKLGLYPATVPKVIYDDSYYSPSWFIVGHDGSYTKMYGEYNEVLGMPVDFRDQILLEYETRVYNNLKLSNVLPILPAAIEPGYFRDTPLSYEEFTDVYSTNFLSWVGQNRLDYKTQLYVSSDPWTYNYRGSRSALDNSTTILQGNWRGIYTYFFDTSTPNATPWEMIGYTDQPSWWEDRYGPAPYTSDNLILWTDMENGYDYNNGSPIERDIFKRPGLLDILPVDSAGELKQPLDCVIGNYNPYIWNRSWIVGDDAATEFSYRNSSTYPFDLMRIEALTKPALFYNLGVDLDNYKYNEEFNQFLVNGRTHLIPSDVEIYGNGTAKTSYINWIVDYQKQLGVDATTKITTLLDNLDVRLVHRLAGFSDKQMLKFFVEKGSPGSPNPSLLIPDESYQVLLYNNQPSDKIVYSGVVVQKVSTGYAIYGNNQTSAYFTILEPVINGKRTTITVQDATVTVANEYGPNTVIIPYGTIYYSEQEVAQFLLAYGRYLESQGMKFEYQSNSVVFNWVTMVEEYLYWVQSGWSVGSVVTLNPAAENITIDKDSLIVQPLTFSGVNFILNNNLYPIQNKDLNILRDGTLFDVKPLNEGDALTYGQFELSNIEHGIVFNNVTLFNDVIYNLQTGLKQNRIYARGTKSAEWNGTMFASGFIYNQDNILEWQTGVKYTKGSIVKYKNKYFTALKIVQPNSKFLENEWKETNYNEIQKGLLPNSSTRSYESALYYNVDKANLEQDADLLSFSLIGFRPRDYMASADLTDITQVNVYKNLIKDKGTLNAMKAFKGANLPQGGIDYDIYENWAILQGSYGGIVNSNFIEFRLNQNLLTGNPSIIGFSNGNDVYGAQQIVPLHAFTNYGNPVTTPNILPLVDNSQNTLFSDAGYVNVNDVKMSAYYYSNLPTAVDSSGIVVDISNLYVNNYVWLASYNANWQILAPTSIGQVIQVSGNLNDTSVVTFENNHDLVQYDIFAIINFDTTVNGYYVVTQVKNQREVFINLAMPPQTRVITGQGIGLKFQSHRVLQPSDIQNLPLLNYEFVKNKAWVDVNNDGNWAVYRKSINYLYDKEFTRVNSVQFGYAVAYSTLSDYLFSDPGLGQVYRYQYDGMAKLYAADQILTQDISFGTAIAHEQNIYVISQPTTTPKVFIYTVNNIPQSDNIIPYQTITAPVGVTSFGDSLAISGDTNWLFVSDFDDIDRNNVHVYRKNNIVTDAGSLILGATYQIVTVGDVNWTDLSDEVIAGVSGVYFIYNGATVTGTGTAVQCDYAYVETLTSGSTSVDKFGYSMSTNYDGTMLFVGAPNEDYSVDVENWGRTYVYNRLVQNIIMDTTYNPLSSPSYTLVWIPGALPVTVLKNGIEVDSSNYSILFDTLTYTGPYTIGDILTISGSDFVNIQILETGQTPKIGVGFGTSVDNNTHATETIVGAPFALSSTNQEGAGYRFTNGGAQFGLIIGTTDVNVTTDRTILLNGYAVTIPAGDATVAASAINSASIINIQATASNGKLIISVVDQTIAVADQKLLLSVVDAATLTDLGIIVYTQTQTILCPHVVGPTQFGTVVKFNEHNSVAISAPVGTRFVQTQFDFTDDENLDNDTVFDNNATQFIDSYPNAGAVYTYDYLSNNNESLANIGAYTYAQSVNAINQEFGASPRYGSAIDWNSDKIAIGVPNFLPESIDGQVVIYVNETGVQDWVVYRYPAETVDINKIKNIQLFSAETNNTLVNLDYIDPLQGKILGAVRQNIDVISDIDPANYNNNNVGTGIIWGAAQVGSIWLSTSNFKYINYHQNDNTYNAKYWGALFPGSDVAVYSWIASNVEPINYQGTGTPLDIFNYTVQTVLNSSNTVTPIYYFWVRNSGIVFTQRGKTLADINLESYISDSLQSGISYLAPIASDAVALYNCKPYINSINTVLNISYNNSDQDNPSHQEFDLIRQDYADDFLPGVPGTANYLIPSSLYNRFIESLSGVNADGQVVPDPFLPKNVQSGVLARPRQSFFYNRFAALKNYIQYANEIMTLYPIVEIRPLAVNGFLQQTGTYYDTPAYWEYVNWWAAGYDDNTKSVLQVPIYADLSALVDVATGTIVTVAQGQNQNADSETYRYDGEGVWTRIGLTNGTIQFSSYLYDYEAAGYGFGGTFYDTDVFDLYPSEETRWIVRALNEQIYTDELMINRNKSLILLFEYIQEETVENQNYLPWLNKTSLIDVSHKIRELKPIQNYLSDNQEFLSGYLNETKPYHVVIKEFLFDYTGSDVYQGNITDFDVPAQYNTTIDKFVSPQLVYGNSGSAYQYSSTSSIWQEQAYTEWFNNFGVSVGQYKNNTIVGQQNYPIATLESYITPTSDSLVVSNAQGFPPSGTIKIYDVTDPTVYETIGYSYVDKENSILTGLSRGMDNTEAASHIPGTTIYMDLPAVLLLNGGKSYANPPRVQAVIPEGYPAPRIEATMEAVLSLGVVSEIIVTNIGDGYVVTPEIVIDPSLEYSFTSGNVNILTNTITLYSPELSTGDLVKYVSGDINVGGLKNEEWYYVNVLNNTPTFIIALYQSYADAMQDTDRVILMSQGSGEHTLEIGARAIAITSSSPVRENNVTLRFDRTSFNTQIQDWTPNAFYGSEFVGYYTESSSSGLQLASVQPDIYTILSSAEGTVFPIQSVANEPITEWSLGPDLGRNVANIDSNQLELSLISSGDDQFPSGSTVGFTVGMPIYFTGDVGPQLLVGKYNPYYVAEIIDLLHFTISDTQGGEVKTLTNFTPENMKCFTGTVTNTAVLTTVYPGIRQAVGTTAGDNTVTVAVTYANTGGTSGLYTNIPVYFTGNASAFNNKIEENSIYYVVSVIDNTRFTMATEENPLSVEVTETNSPNQIICSDTSGFSVNDPIVFDSMVINEAAVNTFGNIVKGQIYYIESIVNNKVVTISESVGGATFDPGTIAEASGTYCYMTSQANCVTLDTANSGSMTLNVGMPISPGQVDGQQFTLYSSGAEYTITGGSLDGLVAVDVTASLGTLDRLTLATDVDAIEKLYVNMPFQLVDAIGGLSAATTYYIQNIGVTTCIVTHTSSSTNNLTVNNTDMLYVNMPIKFSGIGFGNINAGDQYYVESIVDSTHITISETYGGSVYVVTTDSGYMIGTGETYINVSASAGGSVIDLSDEINTVSLNQYPTASPTFTINYMLGNYKVVITDAGSGFALDNTITIFGAQLGGTTPTNNLVLVVNSIDDMGGITTTIASGISQGESTQYYLKVASETTFKVYSDSQCTIPVSGIDFAYGAGSYMVLPEPFYFKPSIVKYNNRVWICMVSNNDPTFVIGKWQIMDSGDRRLNALDRAKGYYAPTVNMPGYDLTQLFTGLTYPNATYKGNAFELVNQFTLDTQLMDQAFTPTNISIPAIVFDGTNYVAPANLPNYSGIIADIEIKNDWLLAKMANQTLALTDLILTDVYVMTSTNSPTPIFKSNNYQVWSTSGWFVPFDTSIADIEFDKKRLIASGLSLNAITEHDGEYVAVGQNIIVTDDLTYWYERLVLENTDQKFYGVSYVQISGFTGYVAVGVNGSNGIIYTSTNGIDWTETTPISSTNYFDVTYSPTTIFVVGANNTILASTDGITWAVTASSGPYALNDIIFADDTLVAVGENGLVLVSTDGVVWTTKTTPTTENLNKIIYVQVLNEWTIVGDNNTIIQTNDITADPVIWYATELFSAPETEYIVQGDAFLSGYGPEELVPGIVYDNLTMIVNTRPGTNWPATEYAHVGYNVRSVEFNYSSSNVYSFKNTTQTPSTIGVFKITNDGLSVTLYEETNDYTVDWVNKTVSLTTPLTVDQYLRIDVYETGNGDQLVESSTDESPIITNEITGFDEVFLNCNYVGSSYTGGGIVVPYTNTLSTNATETYTINDSIVCSDVTDFILNDAVYFAGAVFGNLAIDTPYYVKSINTAANSITVSETLVGGVAGATFNLIDDSGDMTVIIQRGPGDFYTEPAVSYNGSKLVAGHTNYVISTSAVDNSILTYTTDTLTPNQRIKFDNTIFGGITPLTTYYVKNIINLTKFTISATPGGSEVTLSSASGTAIFVTEDYAVALADNQINAKIIFAADYDQDLDYISYTFFTQTDPQYGYTLPQTQVFNGNSTVGPFNLDNYLGGTNVENAVVEVNGLRKDPVEYTINSTTSTLQFVSLTPSSSDVIAVTTYNDTQRQYLFTKTYDTTSKQVTPIIYVNNSISVLEPTARIITSIPHNLTTNDVVRIDGVDGSTQLNGKLFIVEVINSIELRIYFYTHGVLYSNAEPVTNLDSYLGSGYIWKYQSWMLENTYATDNNSTYLTVDDATQLVVDTPVYFTEDGPFIGASVNAGSFIAGTIYQITSLGTTDWNLVAGTMAVVYSVGDLIIATNSGLGSGTAVIYFPCVDIGYPLKSIPEIITGQKYYIKEIVGNSISISETIEGLVIDTLTINSGYSVRVTQWEQNNVDRLWVTINGQRVAVSSLRLSDANEVSILTEVLPLDNVIITSMMPSATPDTQTYIQIVNQANEGSVYRANPEFTTWNVTSMSELTTTLTVRDASKISYTNTQESITPVAVDDKHVIGLYANKNEILQITVYNNNPARLGYIQQDYITTQTTGLGPFVLISQGSWVQVGDELTITVTMGKLLYINGEYMVITSIDIETNTVNVQRGANGSPILSYIPENSTVYSLLDKNRMSDSNYNDTWNKIPGVYNTTEGDPLQIASGSAPRFLRLNHEVGI